MHTHTHTHTQQLLDAYTQMVEERTVGVGKLTWSR